MTINEQIKILDNKIRSNQVQHNLGKQNARISALGSSKLDKYEYLTGEDLGYKPEFEYSPLGQVFNKGLEKDEKQVVLLKRLKNIEDKTDNQLKENKDSQLGIKSIGYDIKKDFSPEGLNAYKKIVDQGKLIDYKYLDMWGGNKKHYDFRMYKSLKELFRTIYYGEMLILAIELKKYRPRTTDNTDTKNNLLNNARNFYEGREMIINTFKNKLFPFYSGNYYEEFKEESSESEDEDKIPDISTLEQMARLDKIYAPLTSRYFMEKSLIGIMNKLKT